MIFIGWKKKKSLVFFSVADCTGHGIPGAFISMIGTILLNEIHNSKSIYLPNEILNELNRLIQLSLTNISGNQMKDGMDISFCTLDKNTKTLRYAGANNPVWIVSKSASLKVNEKLIEPSVSSTRQLFEIKADKQPIGKYMDQQIPFTLHTIQLTEGDEVFLFSDGFADQFGGEKGKKFKYKPFKRLLLELSGLSCDQQKETIIRTYKEWKGKNEQVDDICIIGLKV